MCPLELTFVLPSWHSSLHGQAAQIAWAGSQQGQGQSQQKVMANKDINAIDCRCLD